MACRYCNGETKKVNSKIFVCQSCDEYFVDRLDDLCALEDDEVNKKSFTIVKANSAIITKNIKDMDKLRINLLKTKSLTSLNFVSRACATDACFNLLSGLPPLQELSLDINGLDLNVFGRLSEVLAQNVLANLVIRSFEKLRRLESFSNGLINNNSLKRIGINAPFDSCDELATFIRAVTKNRSITSLELYGSNAYIPHMDIGNLLKFGTLKQLHFGGGEIAPENVDLITEGLISTSTLESLYWSLVPTKEIAKALANGLKGNTTITDLFLNDGLIPEVGLTKEICEALKINQTLTNVNLHGDYVSMESFCDILKHNKSLTKLDVPLDSRIRYDSTNIAEALKINTTLKKLELGSLIFRPYDTFIKALLMNQSLTEIDINLHELTLDEYRVLFAALKQNNHLQRITFGDFKVLPPEVFSEFAQVLKVNRALRYVYLYGSGIDLPAAEQICAALKENDTLTSLSHWWRHQRQFEDSTVLEDMWSVNMSLIDFHFFGSDEISPEACKRNKKYQALMKSYTTILIHNIARNGFEIEIFPREIWLEIFKRLRYPGTSDFGDIAQKIFNSYGTK